MLSPNVQPRDINIWFAKESVECSCLQSIESRNENQCRCYYDVYLENMQIKTVYYVP